MREKFFEGAWIIKMTIDTTAHTNKKTTTAAHAWGHQSIIAQSFGQQMTCSDNVSYNSKHSV